MNSVSSSSPLILLASFLQIVQGPTWSDQGAGTKDNRRCGVGFPSNVMGWGGG